MTREKVASWCVALAGCLAAAVPDGRAGRSDARYRITIGPDPRDLAVEAALSVAPGRLLMSPTAPQALEGGWSRFVHDVRLAAKDGSAIELQPDGASWVVAKPGRRDQ